MIELFIDVRGAYPASHTPCPRQWSPRGLQMSERTATSETDERNGRVRRVMNKVRTEGRGGCEGAGEVRGAARVKEVWEESEGPLILLNK